MGISECGLRNVKTKKDGMMTGVEDRVKGFLEAWEKIERDRDLTSRCEECDREIQDGNFMLISGHLYCLPCGKGVSSE